MLIIAKMLWEALYLGPEHHLPIAEDNNNFYKL
ncbi:hypothetical protein SAMN05444144_102311 [Flavobacterium akiainvivens]|nr:hypothetical protein SAMN05444144_102311 [Flavobacterium akiainvivens]